MLIYTPVITPRLRYIAEFCGREITGFPFELTTDKDQYLQASGPKLNYSNEKNPVAEYWIQPHGLLTETDIHLQTIQCFDWKGLPAFFPTSGDVPFDIFAAGFYLLSRYEEYLLHQKDRYGRYAHENAIAYREKFLHQPLVNQWLQELAGQLHKKFPALPLRQPTFLFLPTYDIDIAWSYRHKGAWRNAGGFIKSMFKGEWRSFRERMRVLRGKAHDPYDAYGWMNRLHEQYALKPYYFFLLAAKTGRYDKNISPRHTALQALISDHLIRYPLGIHPSWQSGDQPALLQQEIAALAAITGARVLSSRQHYIRFTLPDTFRRLAAAGIQFDFSMGYGSINGFRASVCSPFYWYDLKEEKQTNLLLFPFCYMDANSFYEQGYKPAQALDEMRHYYQVVKNVGGTLSMIWHNSFLGTDPLFAGWREVYEEFIKGMKDL